MEKTQSIPPTGVSPEAVFRELEAGIAYKQHLGSHGMFEQNRINERFYSGDQWKGVHCGDSRPLVRHNVIRRIGEYKMAVVGSAPTAVQFTAEGVPNTLSMQQKIRRYRQALCRGEACEPLTPAEESQTVAAALTDYFVTTSRRLGLDTLGRRALRNAYITGTGVLYTYWDDRVRTGMYADHAGTTPIRGDIACEVLDIEQVYPADPTLEELQEQPSILIAQQKPVAQLRREARRAGCADWERIRADDGGEDPAAHATVLTRFWKEWDEAGEQCRVYAQRVCRGAVLRPAWDTGLRLYPLSLFRWEEQRGQVYGSSEIPYLIPNQIAINRTVSAGVWAVMMMGLPIMLVNGDVINQPITNDPGQVIPVYGSGEEVQNAVRYVEPPAFSADFNENVQDLITETMTQAGISTTLLGDVKPDNTSAILAVREASLMPLQMIQNRYFSFIEQTARIWAEFWLTMYGDRALKIEQPDGIWYMPFHADQYRELLLTIAVDVGQGSQYSETRSVETLDNLYKNGIITAKQYLSRLPQGFVPKLDALLQELE